MSEVSLPKRSHAGKLSEVKTLQDAFDHPQFIARLKQAVPRHLSPDRMLAVFIQSVQKTPKLAHVQPLSLLGAFLSLASVGLEPNTALNHAYLIPFEKKGKVGGEWKVIRTDVQVIFGYQGLLELAYRSGLLKSIHCDVVWKDEAADPERFDFYFGSGGRLIHRPLGGVREPDELPVWAYMHANLKDGAESYEVMNVRDIIRIRDASQAYRGAIAAKRAAEEKGYKVPDTYTEAPWVKHPIPMFRKTVMRSGSKWLPKSIELARALSLDEAADARQLEYSRVIEGSIEDVYDTPEPEQEQEQERLTVRTELRNAEGYAREDLDTARGRAERDEKAPPRSQQTTVRWLVDADGELVGDGYSTAEAWGSAFFDLYRKETPERRAAMAEHNADTMAEAGFKVPAEDLEALIPMTEGRDAVSKWLTDAEDRIRLLGNQAELTAWVQNNQSVYNSLPTSKRIVVQKFIAGRAAELNTKPPRLVPAPRPAPEPELEEEFNVQQWRALTIGRIDSARTVNDLKKIDEDGREHKDRVLAADTGVWEEIRRLMGEKLAEVRQGEAK